MRAKKSLGQHFLTSVHVAPEMVSKGGVRAGDTILEIGPGKGVLTTALLYAGAKVVAIEKDLDLIPLLSEKFEKEIKNKQLTLILGDIISVDIRSLLPSQNRQSYRLIANIPYYITGQIIRKFLEEKRQPLSMTLLVQKEVAQRIVAKDSKESLLSLSVKVFGTPSIIRNVSRGSFFPAPNVDSAIIHIADISKDKLKDIDEKYFFTLLHLAFAHKRKQLLPNLGSVYSKDALVSAFEVCSIPLHVRAEDLTLSDFIALCKRLPKI